MSSTATSRGGYYGDGGSWDETSDGDYYDGAGMWDEQNTYNSDEWLGIADDQWETWCNADVLPPPNGMPGRHTYKL